MTAVAVWPRKPTPAELLNARLERGWKPTSSDLRSGPRVLGYAACIFETPGSGSGARLHPPPAPDP